MTTITINERTKAGKIFLEFAQTLPFVKVNNKVGLNKPVAIKLKKEKSPYNPEYVAMILKSAKQKKGNILNPNDIWANFK